MYYNYLAGALIGGVVVSVVLLLISVSINVVAMVYCIYQRRVKLTQNVSGSGGGEIEEEVYEEVDNYQPGADPVELNEAYGSGEISSFTPNLSYTTV